MITVRQVVVVGSLLPLLGRQFRAPLGRSLGPYSIPLTQQKLESGSDNSGCVRRTCVDAKHDVNVQDNLRFSHRQQNLFSYTAKVFSNSTKIFSLTTKIFSLTTKIFLSQLKFFLTQLKNFLSQQNFFSFN